jgi:HAD superfamily 5'-nucleotidase-like hydrolase
MDDKVVSDEARKRLYVNCSLDLRQSYAVGLDLDHTLAVYDDQAVNDLAAAETCRNLIEFRGYPSSISNIVYDNSAISRGIVADTASGALIKLSHRDRVLRARRAGALFGVREIRQTYGDDRIDVSRPGFKEIQSPFDLPVGQLFAVLPDRLRRHSGRTPDYVATLNDIVEMLDRAHTQGELKRHIVRSPGTFIEKRPGVAALLSAIRHWGKKTFLLTNSGYDYTVDLLDYLLPASETPAGGWRTLFDAVVVDAGKPGFFDNADGVVTREIESLEPHGDGKAAVWGGGGAFALEELLGTRGDGILYLGDNPAADAVPSRHRGWRTAMVVPEIETDPYSPNAVPPFDAAAGDGPWGSVFWEDGAPTRFSRIIRETADVFGSRVEGVLTALLDGHFAG